MARSGAIVASLFCMLCGCTESVRFRSLPPGATLTVDNRVVGLTPVEFTAPSKSLEGHAFRYRLEADGYQAAEGIIPQRIAAGRIVGYVFTVGILRAFRGTKAFREPVEVTLQRMDAPATQPASTTSRIEQRLNELKDMRERGVISEEEYKRARGDVLRGIGQ